MFENNNRARPNKVMKTGLAAQERLPNQHLSNIAKVEMYAIQFGDAQGTAHTTVCFKVGDKWYMDIEQGEAFSDRLKPMSEWLVKQVSTAVDQQTNKLVPKEDAVDVME